MLSYLPWPGPALPSCGNRGKTELWAPFDPLELHPHCYIFSKRWFLPPKDIISTVLETISVYNACIAAEKMKSTTSDFVAWTEKRWSCKLLTVI